MNMVISASSLSGFPLGYTIKLQKNDERPQHMVDFGVWHSIGTDNYDHYKLVNFLKKNKPWYFELRGDSFYLHEQEKYAPHHYKFTITNEG